jgi:O-antigen/teichoic acid export membrane protein
MAARMVGFAVAFGIPLLLSRALTLPDFGLYRQAFLVVASAQSILPLGVSLSAFYFLPRERQGQQSIVLNILLFNAVVGAAAWLALVVRPDALSLLFGSGELVPFAPLIGLVIFLSVFSSFTDIVATAHEDVKFSTMFIIGAQVTKSVAMISAALWFASVAGLLYAAVVQGVLQSIVLLWYLHSRFPGFWTQFDRHLLRDQLAYAIPFGVAGLIYRLESDVPNYLVSHAFGAAGYAIFAIGCAQLPLIGLLRDSITSVMIRRVSELQQQGDRRETLALVLRVTRKLALVYLPLYSLLMVVGREFIVTLFTTKFAASWPIFMVNLTLLPFQVLVNDPVLRAHADQRRFLVSLRIVLLGVLVAALQLAIPRFGMLGAIAVVVGIGVVERVVITWRVARILAVDRSDLRALTSVGKIAACAALAALVAIGTRFALQGQSNLLVLVACASSFGAAYATALMMLRVPSPDERDFVRKQYRRLRPGRPVPQAT